MNNLFTNYAGYATTRTSYSMLQDFRQCRRYFSLKRRQGFKEREKRAAMEIGNVVEAALKYYHEQGCKQGTGVDEFKRLWLPFKEREDLTYSSKDGDWAAMYQAGSEMLALYEVKWKSFGYANPKFQVSYKKEVFPGTALAGIDFIAYVDMLALVREPITPLTEVLKQSPQIIIDIKVSGSGLDDSEGLLMLDPQLRSYAWVSGVPDVAFLWMHRHKPSEYKKGDRACLLSDGSDVLVSKGGKSISVTDPGGRNERPVEASALTKQQIKFVRVRIPDEDQREQGEAIGQAIAEIAEAERRGSYPKEPGVRFPQNKCVLCSMLPVCTDNDKLIDEKLVRPATFSGRPASKVVETDWIEEI